MTNLNQEALFSLELIVDQLRFHQSVECRIPAVAFRLLDFPTLLIYHVEPELAATIRSKLLVDRHRPIPAQLNELKDRKTGTFVIGRGKSCLFRVSPNTVLSSFSSAPLYVMVVDMFPEMPKLVGSCGVPLSACARALYDDIVTNGISVPAVQAEKKELDLCNLMGTKLGTVLLGYRLLSLGAALLSHIPTRNIIRIKPEEEINQCYYPTTDEVSQSIIEARAAAKQSTNAERKSENSEFDKILEKTFADSQTQIELPSFGSVSTQTSRPRSHTYKPRTPLANDTDDIITTNIVCPPPLFYNSNTCKKTVCWHQEEWSSVWQMANDGSSWSDDGTIRVEDKYLDADEEATHNMDSSHHTVKHKSSSHAQSKDAIRSDPAAKAPYRRGSMAEFPILGALMAEILRFQGMGVIPDNSGVDADHEVRYKVQKMNKGLTIQKGDHAKPVEPRRSAHKCANVSPAGREQKRRSSRPLVHQKPFFAGMTNTQRLRLAKVNPKLLKELEAKETQRRSEFRAARVSRVRQKENVPTDSQQNADESDTLKHTDISRTTEYVDESRESTARYKCPVPTPRTSKMFVADRDFAGVGASSFGMKTYSVGHKRREPQLLLQSSSEENIEFTLPPMKGDSESDYSALRGQSAATNATADTALADVQAATDAKLNTSGSDDSDAGQSPSVSAPTVYGNASAGNAQVEATDAGGMLCLEDLGLRKIVDHYSGTSDDDDDDDDDDRTECSNNDKELEDRDAERSAAEGEEKSDNKQPEISEKCAEPELRRKVVNQYSAVSDDEEHDLEYEYDFEDTPGQSVMTVSPVNSSTSSIMDSMVPTEAGSNMRMSGHSRLTGRMGEQLSIITTDYKLFCAEYGSFAFVTCNYSVEMKFCTEQANPDLPGKWPLNG